MWLSVGLRFARSSKNGDQAEFLGGNGEYRSKDRSILLPGDYLLRCAHTVSICNPLCYRQPQAHFSHFSRACFVGPIEPLKDVGRSCSAMPIPASFTSRIAVHAERPSASIEVIPATTGPGTDLGHEIANQDLRACIPTDARACNSKWHVPLRRRKGAKPIGGG